MADPTGPELNVAVFGARGRMGAEVCRTVQASPGLRLVAAVEVDDDKTSAEDAAVAVDFTHPDAVLDNLTWCLERGISVVVGTTGFDDERLHRVRELLDAHPGTGAVIAANFSVGAVLMMSFAEQAAAFYESVEIVELHHPDKADAPSGTARTSAARIAAARAAARLPAPPDATTSALPGARGAKVDGVVVHSVRLRGLVAHQEVLFGAAGETLTLRHDSFDRASFMPGVIAAVRAVRDRPGLTLGIEAVLGIGAG